MNYEIGPILMQPDPLRPGFSYKVRNPRCYKAPEIVSFAQILKENYVVEYGHLFDGSLPTADCRYRISVLTASLSSWMC